MTRKTQKTILLIIIALVVWASVGHDNKKAISDKVSPQVSQQAFVYDEEAIENRDSNNDSESYLLPNAVKNQYIKVSPL